MSEPKLADRQRSALVQWARVAAAVVLVLAGLDWLGWLSGIGELTRGFSDWPQMTPWTALLLAVLGVAILLQSGRPSPARVWAACGLAVLAGVFGVVFLAEYATGASLGLSRLLLGEEVRDLPATFPGRRPSLQSGWSVLFLSIAIGLTHLDRRWSRVMWSVCLAAAVAVPIVTGLAYLFAANALLTQAVPAAVGLLLLVVAVLLTRPDRYPVAWLLERPQHATLARVVAAIAFLPIVVGLVRAVLLQLGVPPGAERVLSLLTGTVFVGIVVFFFGYREQRLLAEREELRRQRNEAEALYRLIAENAVDIISYVRGTEVIWVSPSVRAALGWSPQQWIGTDFTARMHPEDFTTMEAALARIAEGKPATARARFVSADGSYRWVEARGKPSVDADGNTDGVVFAARIIDKQVETENQLERLARLDALTGVLNHRECMVRLEAALANRRSPGPKLGLLFCDLDHFKEVNDTWGHLVGDVVLSQTAVRIRDCIRGDDTLGRTGGDEMLVLLPGLKSLEQVRDIAEKIRCRTAEPILHDGVTLRVTLSIGATLADPGESPTAVMARADGAMYKAKHAGRNTVFCTDA
ncbi:MAG: diguanylate cyclase [Mycolicibacterium sp.]|uniref:diguanylate cyclase domain-containing protein n=1 Tax=Mycolicibacterium sp. TaxID=2320850 RepID=UPI003D0A2A60